MKVLNLHINAAHKEVVVTVEKKGDRHGFTFVLKDGSNGLPTYDDFVGYHDAEIAKLLATAGTVGQDLLTPKPPSHLADVLARGAATVAPPAAPAVATEPEAAAASAPPTTEASAGQAAELAAVSQPEAPAA